MAKDYFAEALRRDAAEWNAVDCCDAKGWTYVIEGAGMIKIGRTDGDLAKRIVDIQRMSPAQLRVLAAARGTDWESHLHFEHAKARSHGEWFHADKVAALRLDARRSRVARICLGCSQSKPRPNIVAKVAARLFQDRQVTVEECERGHFGMPSPIWMRGDRRINGCVRTARRCYEERPTVGTLCSWMAKEDDYQAPWPDDGRLRPDEPLARQVMALVGRVQQVMACRVWCEDCWGVRRRDRARAELAA